MWNVSCVCNLIGSLHKGILLDIGLCGKVSVYFSDISGTFFIFLTLNVKAINLTDNNSKILQSRSRKVH